METEVPLSGSIPNNTRLSTKKAVAIGCVVIGLPSLVITAIVVLAFSGQIGFTWSALLGIVPGWTWWSFTVQRWRKWASEQGAPPDEVQRVAATIGLVWPKGWIFEKTEFNWEKFSPLRLILALLPALASLFLAGWLAVAKPSTEWKAFSPEGGGFSVMMPGAPKEEALTQETEVGPITAYVARVEIKRVMFMSIYTDLPNVSLQLGTEEFFRQYREGVVANIEGESKQKIEKVDQESISLNGYPGVALTMEAQGYSSRVRTYLVGKRQYTVTVSGPTDEVTASDATRFLDSLQLLAAPSAP